MESIEQTFNGTVDFGRKVSATISRNGDLIHKTYLQVELPTLTPASSTANWVNYLGHALIKEVEIEIGGARIDRQYGQWLHIWSELTLSKSMEDTYKVMVGETAALTTAAASITGGTTLYVPLQFWFCRNPGLALPLIALQYHEVKINLEFRPFSELFEGTAPASTPSLASASLFVDYVFLDTDERRQFAQVAHEYLIEQLQFTGSEAFAATSVRQKLNFNHPCKELVWVAQLDSVAVAKGWFDFTSSAADHLVDAKLLLNGQDRFSTRKAGYFNLVQPYQHHTRGPARGIYVYSFAIKPEEHQPSGSVNMSRIDNSTLQLTFASAAALKLYTYAVNYNILRVKSGMGGLAYAS
jgi:hypothetical protein